MILSIFNVGFVAFVIEITTYALNGIYENIILTKWQEHLFMQQHYYFICCSAIMFMQSNSSECIENEKYTNNAKIIHFVSLKCGWGFQLTFLITYGARLAKNHMQCNFAL